MLQKFLPARISCHAVLPYKVNPVRRGCEHFVFPSLGVPDSRAEQVIPPAEPGIRSDGPEKAPECVLGDVDAPLTAFPGPSVVFPRHRTTRSLPRPQKAGDQSLRRQGGRRKAGADPEQAGRCYWLSFHSSSHAIWMASRIFSFDDLGSPENPGRARIHWCKSVNRTVRGSISGWCSYS